MGAGADTRQVTCERQRLDALFAQIGKRKAAGAFGEPRSTGIGQQRQMAEFRHLGAERLEQLDLRPGVGHVVGAANDRGDGEVDIVHHGGERVEVTAIGAHQHGIALAGLVDMLGAAHQIGPIPDLARQFETPMGMKPTCFQPRPVGGGKLERGPVIDRRLAALKLQLAPDRELLRRLVAGIERAGSLQTLDRFVVASPCAPTGSPSRPRQGPASACPLRCPRRKPPSSARDRYRPGAAGTSRPRAGHRASWRAQYRHCRHEAGRSGSARCGHAGSLFQRRKPLVIG